MIGAKAMSEDKSNPAPSRAWWLFVALWGAALLLTLIATLGGAIHHVANYEGVRDSWLTREQEKWALLVSYLVPFAVAVATAALLMRAKDRVPAGLMSLSLLLVSATNMLGGNFWISGPLWLQLVLGNAGSAGITISFLIFPDGRFGSIWAKALAIAVGAFALWLTWQQAVVRVDQNDLAANYAPELVRAVFYGLACLALAQKLRRAKEPKVRQQIRWALYTLAAATILFAAYAIGNYYAVGAGNQLLSRVVSQLLTAGYVCLSIGFLIALLRHGLYEVETVLSRTSAYAILTVAWAALFAIGETLVKASLDGPGGVLTALVAAAVVIPLKNAVSEWTDRRFRQPLVELRERLPASMADLRPLATLDEVLDDALSRIAEALHPAAIAAAVAGETPRAFGVPAEAVSAWLAKTRPTLAAGAFECERGEALFPVRMPLRISAGGDTAPVGWLLIGPPADGGFYCKDELAALANASVPIARAVRAVQLRMRQEARAGSRGKAPAAMAG